MINKIIIKGFENHIDSELEFVNGLNIITGVSNTGKSSIVKSLNWLINNQPSGDGYINNDLKKCQVISYFNNDKIEKYKDEKEHYYKINDENEFTALKQNIPEQVQNITNFTEMNLQSQFDKFFLLQDTSGEVARKLNNIINLSIMDEAIKTAKSKVYKKARDIEKLEEDVLKLQKDLNKFDWLDNVEGLINDIKKLNNEKENKINKINELKNIYNEYKILNDQIKQLNGKLLLKPIIILILTQINNAITTKQQNNKINSLWANFIEIKQDLNNVKEIIKYKDLVNDINQNIKFYEKWEKRLNNLIELNENYKNIQFNLKKYINIDEKKEKISILLKKFKEYSIFIDKIQLLKDILFINDKINDISAEILHEKNELNELQPEGSVCVFCGMEIKRNKK